MISLTNPEDARNGAQVAVNEMKYAIAELNKRYDIDVRSITEELAANTPQFGLRAKYNFIWRYGSKIDWFFTEVDNLAKGIVPKNTSEFDAAKRMNIGTITGKHQQKALALKNITQNEFTVIKQEFATVLNANKAKAAEVLAEASKRENPKAFITTNVEVFANVADFITGLEYCKNPYDFFETLPLTGIAAKVKRNEGYMENARLIEMKNVYLTADSVNSAFLTNSTNQWNVPMQVGDEKVEINAILPIFRLVHAEFLRPLLKTRLMKLIFSFLFTTNYDAIYEDAYLNILASTLLLAY